MLSRMNRVFFVGLCLTGTLPCALIVVPNSVTSIEAPNGNTTPYDAADLIGGTSVRYQEVFDGSQVSPAGVPILITGINYRPDATFGRAFSATIASIRIDLGTTSAMPSCDASGVCHSGGKLSTIFANNVRPDDVIVFPTGPLSLSSAFTGPAGGPKDFDIHISLVTPFLYNPAIGNLLLDVRNFSGERTTAFDEYDNHGGAARAFARNPGNVNSTIADASDGGALVTQFEFTEVPEVSTGWLTVIPLFGLYAVARTRRLDAIAPSPF